MLVRRYGSLWGWIASFYVARGIWRAGDAVRAKSWAVPVLLVLAVASWAAVLVALAVASR